MNFTDIFIRRPVLATVIGLLILIAGLQAIRSLNVRQYPTSEHASITVTTVYVGASAELVRGFITTPLERAISAADGIDYLESQSSLGVSTIRARLKLNYDATKALAEISSKVDQVRADLPPESEVPVINIESADSEFATAYLSFTSDVLQQNEITDYLVRVVQPRLTSLEGIQRADILGARTFAMRIWLQPDRMAAYNISPTQVRQALAANNFLSALGKTKGSLIQVNLSANTNLTSVDEFKQLVVFEHEGTLVRLDDIARISLGAEDYDSEVRFTGQTAVFIGIWPMPNANPLDVIERVRSEISDIQTALPTGLAAQIAYDSTEYIENAIDEVIKTLGQTLIIVIVVIFLFLGAFRTALVPVLAIPLALIGAVFIMQVFGFTINLLTLLAIVLSVGLVVDDAIVMVENIERHMREGEKPFVAAIRGARELVMPVVATSLVLVAVYTPVGLQGGLTGSLFREFAFTLVGTIVVSTLVALTISPVVSSKLLKPGAGEKGLAGRISRDFDRLRDFYGRLLAATLKARPAVYLVWIVTAAVCIPMYTMSPTELAPTEDQGVVFGIIDAAANATLDQTAIFTKAVNDAYMSVPETRFTFQVTNPGGGFAGMVTEAWEDRERSIHQIFPEVQGKLQQIPGIRVFAVLPPALPGGGQFPVEFIIASTAETDEVLEFANQLRQRAIQSGMFAFPPLIDVKVDQPQSEVILDRDMVADLGLDLRAVGADVGAMVGGNYVNRFDISGRSYKVIPQIQRADRLNPEQLRQIYITGPENSLVPLSTVATLEESVVPRSLNRFRQLNAVKLSGTPLRPLGEALTFLEQEAADLLPDGYVIDYTGESRQLRNEGQQFLLTFLLAIALIFLTLAAQFNSFRDPLVILAGSVPTAMFGALVFIFLKMPDPRVPFWTDGWTTTLNIYSQVGLVTLVGLVAKNGILVVEFANKLQLAGRSKLDAIQEASMTRLRAILMTSSSTVAGFVPLVLVSGAGAAARNSIGLVVVGGMLIGTLFTLFVIPSVYMLIARDHNAEKQKSEEKDQDLEEGATESEI